MGSSSYQMEFLELNNYNISPKVFVFFFKYDNSEMFVETNILETLVNEYQLNGVYVSLYKPYSVLNETFFSHNINTQKLYVVDCLPKNAETTFKLPNYISTSSPAQLTQISVYVTAALMSSNYNFLLIDSLDVLQNYNDVDQVKKFLIFLIQKFKALGIGINMVGSKNSKPTINVISQYCDKVITVNK